jgi:two-component system sensor histidine kinase/response regulator
MNKILLVEDELALRETLQEILEFNDFEVSVAESGEEALESIQKIAPDLIVSDIMMPGMTGLELIKEVHLQNQFKDIPFIFLSALASKEDQNNGILAGAKGYITKPFKAYELMGLIRELLG